MKQAIKLSKRILVPRFWANAKLAKLERTSGIRNFRLTLMGLWSVADEAGIFEWEPEVIGGLLYPYNMEDQDAVEPAMNALAEHEEHFIKKIEVNGKWFGYHPHWGEHNEFRKNASRYPEVFALIHPSDTLMRAEAPSDALKRPLEAEAETEAETETAQSAQLSERQQTGRQEKQNPFGLDPDFVLFWAKNVSNYWPTAKVYDAARAAQQCDSYLGKCGPEKRKAVIDAWKKSQEPAPEPKSPAWVGQIEEDEVELPKLKAFEIED